MARGDQIKKLRDKAQPKVNIESEESCAKSVLIGTGGSFERHSVLQYTGISKDRVGFTRNIFKRDGTIEKCSPQMTFSALVRLVQRNLLLKFVSHAHVQALSDVAELPRQPNRQKAPTV